VAAVRDDRTVAAAHAAPAVGDVYVAGPDRVTLNGEPATVSDRDDPETFVVAPAMGWGAAAATGSERSVACSATGSAASVASEPDRRRCRWSPPDGSRRQSPSRTAIRGTAWAAFTWSSKPAAW